MPDMTDQQLRECLMRATVAHSTWKSRLGAAINAGTSEFSPNTVRVDDQCEFGKCLYKEMPERVKASAEYRTIKDLHARFHVTAAEVLQLALTGKKVDAEARMAVGGDFTRLSSSLVLAIKSWKDKLP